MADVKIQEIKSEVEDNYSDDDIYNINSWGADLSFRELITMYKEDELIKPGLQRYYVWERPEASRFIESILLGLPVPSIFLAKTKREKKLIIDGYQRIMTVYDYERGIFSKDNKIFRLSNSESINKRWRGKAFSELAEHEQRRIRSTTIHAIIFEQSHPKDSDTSLYQIFERINTTGRMLLTQEIRNCVYQGMLNDLLKKLNEIKEWRELYGSEDIDSRMRDVEFILRFLAMANDDIKTTKANQISMKKYLNDFMGAKAADEKDNLNKWRILFTDTIKFIHENIGLHAFHNYSIETSKYAIRFHPTIFDAISLATSIALPHIDKKKLTNLEGKRLELLKNEDFKNYITVRTTNLDNIRGRIRLSLKYLYDMDYE